ncbi:bifunctional adenosylcobinamide kinase/adenosylcobinamide-phosphate guanylyltransferase [Variovorax ureilyticus]|uniref:Bifunctional adenosylcobalamin biosynthesis protein n=1 Tax=Variovorax ureilyticus TaxID=1836198 RepID=A0ABU8V8A6_9BURK
MSDVCRELILGGQKSGKSRRGEELAAAWLGRSNVHRAVLIATAQAHDDEMRARIARHRRDRALRVPGLGTVEEPLALAEAIRAQASPNTLVLVDCLTLWLTNLMMPVEGIGRSPVDIDAATDSLVSEVGAAGGPVVLIGNEIGLGVIPLGREVRAFVDALGMLNQRVAAACDRVTLMAAGLPLTLKEPG